MIHKNSLPVLLIVCSTVFIFLFTYFLSVEVALYQPSGSSFSIDVGTNLTLSCHADGINSPVFIWRHINRALLDSDKYVIKTTELLTGLRNISGIKGSMSSLTITDITERDEGQYTCIANNEVDIPQRHEFTVTVNDIVFIDYCSPDLCNGNGVCANLPTTYECICNEDYTGTNCQTGKINTKLLLIICNLFLQLYLKKFDYLLLHK